MGRVYACSDLHGCGYLWNQIKDFLNVDDILYYLGDATDRGPDGWKMIKEMLNDKRIIYIAGNHDIMLADRIGRPYDYNVANIHHANGGQSTWEDAKKDPEINDIKIKIRSLPLYSIYTNINGIKIFMSHSGSTNINNPEDLIWDRNEYLSKNKPEPYDIVVHGHTNIPYMIKDFKEIETFFQEENKYKIPPWEGGALWYSKYRCNIDCCSIETNHTVLLDLNTFDEHIFIDLKQ